MVSALEGRRILRFLIQRRGEVLPRSSIASQVWNIDFNSDCDPIEIAIADVFSPCMG